jgi:FdrA protein
MISPRGRNPLRGRCARFGVLWAPEVWGYNRARSRLPHRSAVPTGALVQSTFQREEANEVRRGLVAVVGASGTGLREVSTLLHHYGAGVSEVLATEGRDMLATGAGTLKAIDRVSRDLASQVIVLVSRPPSPLVAARVLDRAVSTGRRVVAVFLGYHPPAKHPGVAFESTLEDAARTAAVMAGANRSSEHPTLKVTIPRFTREQRWLRALYTGGTLGYEALALLSPSIHVASNLKFLGVAPLGSVIAPAHTLIDLGDEAFRGRAPHPRADLSSRLEAIRAVGRDPTAAVLLFDLVLGRDAHPDPASMLAPSLHDARSAAAARGGTLVMVGSVTGTDEDPQVRGRQAGALTAAGVEVCSSNAAAVRRARAVIAGEWP